MPSSDYRRRVLGHYGLGAARPDASDIARAIVWEAVRAGGSVRLDHRGEWWIIAADVDWLDGLEGPADLDGARPRSPEEPHSLLAESLLPLLDSDMVTFVPPFTSAWGWFTTEPIAEVPFEILEGAEATIRDAARVVAFRLHPRG